MYEYDLKMSKKLQKKLQSKMKLQDAVVVGKKYPPKVTNILSIVRLIFYDYNRQYKEWVFKS